MRVTIDLMKKSTQIIDLSNVINPRVGDDDLLLPLHIVYDDNQTDMRGKDVEFLSNDTNKKRIYIAGTCNTNTPGDNLLMGNLTFRFPAGTFKADGTYDPDKTMFRIVDKETQKVISSVNVKITVMKNNIEFDFDPDKSSYDSRAEAMLNDFKDKGQAMLDEIKDLKNQANSNVSGDTATTAKEAKQQANTNASNISDMQNEIAGARGRFTDMAGRENAQDDAINTKESIVNANANYANLRQKDQQQDTMLAQKAGKFELEQKLAQMNLQPEMYADLDAVRAAYPNGATKLIATDDGYLALYRNGQWIKGPIFLAAGIADGSITDSKLKTINAKRLYNNDIDFTALFPFNNTKYDVEDDQISLTIDGDGGVFFPTKSVAGSEMFLNYELTEVSGSFSGHPQFYLSNEKHALGKLVETIQYKDGYKGTLYLNNIDDNQVIVFSIHGTGTVSIKLRASDLYVEPRTLVNGTVFADLLETSHIIDLQLWNSPSEQADKNTFQNNQNKIRFKQNVDGNYGVEFIAAKVKWPYFINMKYRAKGNCDVYAMDNDGNISLLGKLKVDGTVHTFNAQVSQTQMKIKSMESVTKILVSTHKKGSCIEIYDFNFGNVNGSKKISNVIDYLIDQVGYDDRTQIGVLPESSTDILQHEKTTYVTANQVVTSDDQVVRRIQISSKKSGTATIAIGTIDQYGLLVNPVEHQLQVYSGYNDIAVQYPIKTNQRVLLKWDDSLFDLYSASEFNDSILIQDNTHYSNETGYEGYSFYEISGQLPLTYEYSPQTVQEKLANYSTMLITANDEIKKLKTLSGQSNIIRDKEGIAYKLNVVDGKLEIKTAAPSNVTIFGNSLTFNTGKIGMAASDQYHDWYYLTSQYLQKQNPNVAINPRLNAATWEQATTSDERQKVFDSTIKPVLSADTDLVIIQFGDNASTLEREVTLEQDSETLIDDIRQVSPEAEIYWITGWFNDGKSFAQIKQACAAKDAHFVPINDLSTKENQSEIGLNRIGIDGKSYPVVSAGVAAHPGDKGMKAIADRLIANFDF